MSDVRRRRDLQISLGGLTGLVAGVAVCVWLFRFGAFPGLAGLYVLKHVAIAYLCRVLGVNERRATEGGNSPAPVVS